MWGLLWFHIIFKNICSGSVKYIIGILIRIVLNLQIALSRMDILMMLILPTHEHSMCFYLIIPSSISSVSYNFLSTDVLHPLLSLFLDILLFFKQLWIEWDCFQNFHFVISLLAYINATDFWILILYPVTLLNSFISLVVSWWNLWGSLCTVSCHLQIKTVLLLLFQFGCLLLLLVWLLWLGLPLLHWIRKVKVGIPVLFPILMGMLVVSAHWVWSWQQVCYIWPLLCLSISPLITLCWEFLS